MGIQVYGTKLNHLHYADDKVLINNNAEEVQVMLTTLRKHRRETEK